MTPDSNGILYLEETDPITPFQTTINALQAATSSAIGDFDADVSAMQAQLAKLPQGNYTGVTPLTVTGSLVQVVTNPWPAGFFSAAPNVTGVISAATSATAAAILRIDNVTTSSFRVIITGVTGAGSTSLNVVWTAVLN